MNTISQDPSVAVIAALQAEVARLRESCRLFIGCQYPVAKEINERGYAWSEAYLDDVLPIVRAALRASEEKK